MLDRARAVIGKGRKGKGDEALRRCWCVMPECAASLRAEDTSLPTRLFHTAFCRLVGYMYGQ